MPKFENRANQKKSLKIISNLTISSWQAELTVDCRRDIATLQRYAPCAGKQKYVLSLPV